MFYFFMQAQKYKVAKVIKSCYNTKYQHVKTLTIHTHLNYSQISVKSSTTT